jgi:hypothetical protein
MYLHLTPYKIDIIFLIQQALVHDYYGTEILFFSILTTLNVKIQNYKVVHLIESYNFDVKSIFISHHTKKILFV